MENTDQQLLENVTLELRRGVIVLAVLSQLEQEQYGYSLIKLLSDQKLAVDQETLYPLLRRLESQGLLASDWRVEDARPRRYYTLSSQGKNVLPQIKLEWKALVKILGQMLS
jgi:DNA-binding PadR family transcriptional regulator